METELVLFQGRNGAFTYYLVDLHGLRG